MNVSKSKMDYLYALRCSHVTLRLECRNVTYLLESDVEFISKTLPGMGLIH